MKTRKLTAIFAFLLITSAAISQDYAFKVMANKGANEVKSGDTWTALKTGASLKATDELKLVDNAYVGLISAEGKPLEVRDAGPHKVADLTKKIKGGSGVITKYTDFILSSNAETKKNRLSATGAVHRGVNAIVVHLPENQHASILNNTAVIGWHTDIAGPYIVTITNMASDELAKIETTEKSIAIDVKDPKYKFNTPSDPFSKCLVVSVKAKNDPKQTSRDYMIKAMDAKESENMKKELTTVVTEVTEPTALNQIVLAGFYEDHHLLIDALAAYQEAMRLAPDAYTEQYEDFIVRNNMHK